MVTRSQLCPCGSGKKYKRCCGAGQPARSGHAPPGGFALAHQLLLQRDFARAESLCEQALADQPGNLDGWFLLAAIALEQPALERAVAAMRRAAAVAPQRPEVSFNLGHIHERRGDTAAAIDAYSEAVRLAPDYAAAWNNLGNCLRQAGRIGPAIQAYRHGVHLTPQAATAWNNLGVVLKIDGQFAEALACYRRAIAADPRYAPAHGNLGNLHAAMRDYAAAEASLREALRLDPRFVDATLNLAGVLRLGGQGEAALALYRQALQVEPHSAACWVALAAALQNLRFAADHPQARSELTRLLDHPAVDALGLVPAALSLLAHALALAALLDAAEHPLAAATPTLMAPWFDDTLLAGLLESTVITDPQFELALRRVRAGLLFALDESAGLSPAALAFCVRLAQQCHLTEYVYAQSLQETGRVEALARRLERDLADAGAIDAAQVAIYACYRPLTDLPGHARLCGAGLPVLAPLIAEQIEAPLEEARLIAGLARIGSISDAVSQAVQAQYEAHPYPRWKQLGMPGAQALAQAVRAIAPQAAFPAAVDLQAPQVLVAGCGTGRHPIQTATRIAGAQVLAVDLSAASLAYGLRKARELGVANLQFMQGDILELGQLTREFDLIESFGVLHHMRDPLRGWRVLSGLLKPGGLMLIGLYSERGRAPVVACRQLVGALGFGDDAAEIRRFRQYLLQGGPAEVRAALTHSPDFYSISDCRDLIFHVQEHRYTLPQIAAMGRELGLECLGLELDDPALYAGRAGGAATLPPPGDLEAWDRFEQAHPQAFGSTYKIWWQKPWRREPVEKRGTPD